MARIIPTIICTYDIHDKSNMRTSIIPINIITILIECLEITN